MAADSDETKRKPVSCIQCEKVGIWRVKFDSRQSVMMCQDHYDRFAAAKQLEFENAARLVNLAADHIDAIAPWGPRTPRLAMPKPAVIVRGGTMNHISINKSVIGTVNTGTIGQIDQTVSALLDLDQKDVADAIKRLTEAVTESRDLSAAEKDRVNEMIGTIAEQAAAPEAVRKVQLAVFLIESARSITEAASDIAERCRQWWPTIVAAFPVASGS